MKTQQKKITSALKTIWRGLTMQVGLLRSYTLESPRLQRIFTELMEPEANIKVMNKILFYCSLALAVVLYTNVTTIMGQ